PATPTSKNSQISINSSLFHLMLYNSLISFLQIPFFVMEEEFQESEVIFQENIENEENDRDYYEFQNGDLMSSNFRNSQSRKRLKKISNSIPISIPDNLSRNNSWFKHVKNNELNFFEDEEYGDDGEMVPPHVITSRRIAGKMMSFSICSGYGRTLKGRDLSQVRNSILRMTGFLET
ncbi:hypothetical protein AABB24_004869, partial [Solanum stoloniferum]